MSFQEAYHGFLAAVLAEHVAITRGSPNQVWRDASFTACLLPIDCLLEASYAYAEQDFLTEYE